MTDSHPTEFVCPECGSGYKVVRVKADAASLIDCSIAGSANIPLRRWMASSP
jgi:hypothetical protein